MHNNSNMWNKQMETNAIFQNFAESCLKITFFSWFREFLGHCYDEGISHECDHAIKRDCFAKKSFVNVFRESRTRALIQYKDVILPV